MKNINLLQTIKTIIVGFILGVGFTYTFASWTAPTGTPSQENNAPAPINVSSTNQSKGGDMQPLAGSLLNINGTLSSQDLAVFGNTTITGDMKVSSLGGTSDRWVCVDSTGVLKICSL